MFRGSNEVNLLKKDCLGIFLSKSPLPFRATKVCQSRINRHAVLIFLLHNVMSLELSDFLLSWYPCSPYFLPTRQCDVPGVAFAILLFGYPVLIFLLESMVSRKLGQISYSPDTQFLSILFKTVWCPWNCVRLSAVWHQVFIWCQAAWCPWSLVGSPTVLTPSFCLSFQTARCPWSCVGFSAGLTPILYLSC